MMRLKVFALMMAASLLLAGCGGKSESAPPADIVPTQAAASLLEQLEFPEELLLADGAIAENYYRMNDSIGEYAVYISGSGATANEIAVLKVNDPAKLEEAKAILNKRLEDLKFQFENYVPAEMDKLADPVIEAKGDVAIMVLSNDSAAAKKAVKALLG